MDDKKIYLLMARLSLGFDDHVEILFLSPMTIKSTDDNGGFTHTPSNLTSDFILTWYYEAYKHIIPFIITLSKSKTDENEKKLSAINSFLISCM